MRQSLIKAHEHLTDYRLASVVFDEISNANRLAKGLGVIEEFTSSLSEKSPRWQALFIQAIKNSVERMERLQDDHQATSINQDVKDFLNNREKSICSKEVRPVPTQQPSFDAYGKQRIEDSGIPAHEETMNKAYREGMESWEKQAIPIINSTPDSF